MAKMKTRPTRKTSYAKVGVDTVKEESGLKLLVEHPNRVLSRDDLMSWCEENRVEYVFGLARNRRLVAKIKRELVEARAESRAALARDPASHFLRDQLDRALDKKLELLRTAALLRPRT